VARGPSGRPAGGRARLGGRHRDRGLGTRRPHGGDRARGRRGDRRRRAGATRPGGVAAARERSAGVLAHAERRSPRPVWRRRRDAEGADAALATARHTVPASRGTTTLTPGRRWPASGPGSAIAPGGSCRWRQAEALPSPTSMAGRAGRAQGPAHRGAEIAREPRRAATPRELRELAGRALIRLPDDAGRRPVSRGTVARRAGVASVRAPRSHQLRDEGRETPARWSREPARPRSRRRAGTRSRVGDVAMSDGQSGSELLRGFVGEPTPRRAIHFGSARATRGARAHRPGPHNREMASACHQPEAVGVHVGNILSKARRVGRVRQPGRDSGSASPTAAEPENHETRRETPGSRGRERRPRPGAPGSRRRGMSLGGDVELVVVGWVGENVSWVLARRSSCGSYIQRLPWATKTKTATNGARMEPPVGALHDASGHGEHDSCGSRRLHPGGIAWTARNAEFAAGRPTGTTRTMVLGVLGAPSAGTCVTIGTTAWRTVELPRQTHRRRSARPSSA